MAPVVAIDVIAGLILVLAWYCWFSRCSRQKAREIVSWIEHALQGQGRVIGTERSSDTQFGLQLCLASSPFRRASVQIRLHRRELPVHWLISVIRGQQETLTFQADLDCAPCFNLEVHNHRWMGRAQRRKASHNWRTHHADPFVLTTRKDWQREITSMMGALVASRECDCVTVCFRRTSPHFSATLPVAALSPDSRAREGIFDVLRELAAGAASARF